MRKSLTLLPDVETVFLVVIPTHSHILSHHCYIFPFSWMPIRVIITLLGTFVSPALSVRVLSGSPGTALVDVLVSGEQSWKKKKLILGCFEEEDVDV